jgi:hypothetical protein
MCFAAWFLFHIGPVVKNLLPNHAVTLRLLHRAAQILQCFLWRWGVGVLCAAALGRAAVTFGPHSQEPQLFLKHLLSVVTPRVWHIGQGGFRPKFFICICNVLVDSNQFVAVV